MSDPLAELEEEREKTAAKRKADDFQQWQQWKVNPTPTATSKLIKRFSAEQNSAFKKYRAPGVDSVAFKTDLRNKTLKALDTYKPDKNTAVSTWVSTVLSRSQRYNAFNQNKRHIPERQAKLIGPIDTAVDRLKEQLGREPTFAEISRQSGIAVKRVKEVQRARVKDIGDAPFEGGGQGVFGTSSADEVTRLLRPTLKPAERDVFDVLYGLNGRPKLTSTGAIARELGKSDPQISKIRGAIGRAYKKYK